jgi:orotidine-5'-phosphate decarboxylase
MSSSHPLYRPTLADRLILALDTPTQAAAERLLEQLKPTPLRHVKVGLSLVYQAGLPWVATLVKEGFHVFLDVKVHDIPNTVARTLAVLAGSGAQLMNVHASGGPAMLAAAQQALTALPAPPALIAVTVLTSLEQAFITEVLGHPEGTPLTPKALALQWAAMAKAQGLAGVVCSAQEAAAIAEACGDAFLRITPGIRLPQQALGDQQRVLTPQEALRQGATHLVVGRPVLQAPQPMQAVDALLQAMAEVL